MRIAWREEGEDVFNPIADYFDAGSDETQTDGETAPPIIKREDVIAAYKPYVEQGIKDPYEIDSQELDDMHAAYQKQQWALQKTLPLGERIHEEISEMTVYFDAGFTDFNTLDEIANDWLLNPLSEAKEAHRRDLADRVKAKITEVEKKIKELNPIYELTDWSKADGQSWNPSRIAGPKEFYADFAYWKGGSQKTNVEDVVLEYKKFHPDANDQAIKADMEKAAAEYTETA